MGNQKFEIVSALSNINWVGRKITGAHNGTIGIKAGQLIMDGDRLKGGRIIVDTASIRILDITDLATNAQFAGHLASDDFFSTEKYPEAILEITSASAGWADAHLTIKGTTHSVTFETHVDMDVNQNTVIATGKMVIDRTKYGMRFRSGNFFKDLGDNLIYNDFELDISVIAKAV